MVANPKRRYTLEEYFELERKSEERFEFWDGEVFCMSGVSREHDQIESNLNFHLRAKLAGRKCRAFLANMRLKVPSAPPYRYADLSALCGEAKFEEIGGVDALLNPSLLIEVLSPSTEAYDRGDKFTHYKSIPCFDEYLLVAQHRAHVTHFAKQSDGSWAYNEYNDLEATLKLSSLDCELTMREVYENVSFDAPPDDSLT
ncbi:MAG TPA: Uma2 family endonuclease [Pyrinomonadaceae bacterium]|nr:Uma2 family endonuclease [Pyrinomonadaceae bacterium]